MRTQLIRTDCIGKYANPLPMECVSCAVPIGSSPKPAQVALIERGVVVCSDRRFVHVPNVNDVSKTCKPLTPDAPTRGCLGANGTPVELEGITA